MAKIGVIANPQRVPEWVATCPTCGGPVECGIEEWESATGIVTDGGLYVECAADDHEGAIETRMPYVYWLPVRQRVLAWARLALRMGDAGVRAATSREVWWAMAETSTIRKGLTPWGSLSATRFMKETVGHAAITESAKAAPHTMLSVVPRPDVATGQWWSLSWVGEDGDRHDVAASSLALLMERAAAVELGVRDEAEREWGEGARDGGR
jgi:hypothetical protein